MNFHAPWAAWFLAGIPVLVLLYLLKVRRQPQPVSSLLLWQQVLGENRRRALFQRLRHLLSLLLQILIFLLLVGALARPVLDHNTLRTQATVLVLDARARMQAVEPTGRTRFATAVERASAATAEASASRPVAILSAGAQPTVACAFNAHPKALAEVLEKMTPEDCGGSLEPTIRLARELAAAHQPAARILVFTDTAPEATSANSGIEFIALGSPLDNVAITRFASRAQLNSPDTSEVFLEARNFGSTAAEGSIELSLDGRLLDVRPFQLAPGASFTQSFPSLTPPPDSQPGVRGWLRAHIDRADALPLDNTAYTLLPAPKTRRVLLVSKGNWFLEKLLEADRKLRFELLSPEDFDAPMSAQFDVVLFDATLPTGFDLERTAGNLLFLNQSPWGPLGAEIPAPITLEADSTHPVTRLVNLQNVNVRKASHIAPPDAAPGWRFAQPLRALDQTVLLTGEQLRDGPTRRIAVLGFELTQSDLPLRIAFPLLISNTLQWLAGSPEERPLQIRAGEPLSLAPQQTASLRPQTTPPALTAPPSASAPAQDERVHALLRPLHNGYYRIDDPAGSSWLAVNTFDPAESDFSHIPAASTAPWNFTQSVAASPWMTPWRLLALAALLLSALEWALFHRRRTE